MTREEAKAIIRKEYLCVDRDCDIERSCGKCDLMMPSKEPILQAYELAIKALEQEPCEVEATKLQQAYNKGFEDCRQALLDAFGFSEKTRKWGGDHSGYNTMMLYEIQDMIESAPSVKQEPKTGYLSIDDVMSVFDDFMCGEVDEDGMDTFLEMLKDKAESEDKE